MSRIQSGCGTGGLGGWWTGRELRQLQGAEPSRKRKINYHGQICACIKWKIPKTWQVTERYGLTYGNSEKSSGDPHQLLFGQQCGIEPVLRSCVPLGVSKKKETAAGMGTAVIFLLSLWPVLCRD